MHVTIDRADRMKIATTIFLEKSAKLRKFSRMFVICEGSKIIFEPKGRETSDQIFRDSESEVNEKYKNIFISPVFLDCFEKWLIISDDKVLFH